MIGFWQIVVILVIVVIIFGPSRLEKLGPSLGKAIRGFKDGLNNKSIDDEEANKKEKLVQKDSENKNSES